MFTIKGKLKLLKNYNIFIYAGLPLENRIILCLVNGINSCTADNSYKVKASVSIRTNLIIKIICFLYSFFNVTI